MPVRRARAMLAGSLATAVAAVALSGCTQDSAAPAPLETTTSSPTVTPSESPAAPPPMPDEARGTSRKAAVAFVRHWVDTLNYSADTLDSAPLKALSSPDCNACSAALRVIGDLREKGGYITGHEWTIEEIEALSGSSDLIQVDALVHFAPTETIHAEGRKPKRYEAGSSVYTFSLSRTAQDSWVLLSMTVSQ